VDRKYALMKKVNIGLAVACVLLAIWVLIAINKDNPP
jgi:uncharacterized membrane protein YukC